MMTSEIESRLEFHRMKINNERKPKINTMKHDNQQKYISSKILLSKGLLNFRRVGHMRSKRDES